MSPSNEHLPPPLAPPVPGSTALPDPLERVADGVPVAPAPASPARPSYVSIHHLQDVLAADIEAVMASEPVDDDLVDVNFVDVNFGDVMEESHDTFASTEHAGRTAAEEEALAERVAAYRRAPMIDESRIFPGGFNYSEDSYVEVASPDASDPAVPDAPRRAKREKSPKAPRVRKARTSRSIAAGSKKPWWQYEITAHKIKPVELMNFSRQCSSFIRAGIPILDALEVIAGDTGDKRFRSVLDDISDRLRGGSGFADAIDAQAVSFPPYYVSMIRSAEMTGRLDEVLDQLAGYMERDLETRRKIRSALTYPSVVAATGVITVVVLAVYVLPKFETFFNNLGATLPMSTRMLLGVSSFMGSYGVPVLGGCVALIVGLALYLRTERGKARRDAAMLRMPGVGTLARFVAIERFCRGLAALVNAGVPLPDAMAVAADTTGNRTFIRRLGEVRDDLIRGDGLAGPIAQTGLFPAAANQMIRVGEATGTLDRQLVSASDFYERELDYRLKRFTDLFEPVVIIAMGVIVGFVAIALVQAMYGVYSQVQA